MPNPIRFLTVCASVVILNCWYTPGAAIAQGRDWTSRFLPEQETSDEDNAEEVEDRERERYYRNLVGDENDVRREADRLRRLTRNAQSFSSGRGSAAQQTAFTQLLQQVGAREQVAAVLHEEVPELETDNFETEPFCDLVETDGNLVEPPLILQQGRAETCYSAVETAWFDVANSLTTDPPMTPDVDPLAHAMAHWKSVYRADADARELTPEGLEANAYFSRTDDLLIVLNSSEERARLSMFLLHSGFPFPGGTVGDLVQHIVDNELTVQLGSAAHVVLAHLTQEMMLEAAADLAVYEDRIEFYKQQSLASEGSPGGSGFRSRGGQSGSSAPTLPRRDLESADAPADEPAAPVPRGFDDPFRRRQR